jgi:hypothetical protein
LASKTCYEATYPERFRHIHLAIAGPQKLQRDTQRWRTGHRLRFVRSVKITGVTVSPSVEEELIKNGDISGSTLPAIQVAKWRDIQGRNWDVDEEVPELFSGLDKPTMPGILSPLPSTAWLDDSAWKPLVDLIRDLPALQDVIFASTDRFPRLLLSQLHEHHPHCRLHIHNFKLRSLILRDRAEQGMHPDDIALATSPCLYSIVVQTQPYHCAQTLDYNEEAVVAMVKGAAPNLRNVSLTHGYYQGAPGVFRTIPRPQWKGFEIPIGKPDGEKSLIGRLENLALNRSLTAVEVLQWSRCTDFHYLRSMKAGPNLDISAVRRLAEVSRQTPLKALSSLHLKLASSLDGAELGFDAAVAELLQSLCPLDTLELEGHVGEKSFEAITTHHAERLCRLTFTCHDLRENTGAALFRFSPERAAQLSRECPRLETVDVREPKLTNGFFNLSDFDDSD